MRINMENPIVKGLLAGKSVALVARETRQMRAFVSKVAKLLREAKPCNEEQEALQALVDLVNKLGGDVTPLDRDEAIEKAKFLADPKTELEEKFYHPHDWSESERCARCGDKDWMMGPCKPYTRDEISDAIQRDQRSQALLSSAKEEIATLREKLGQQEKDMEAIRENRDAVIALLVSELDPYIISRQCTYDKLKETLSGVIQVFALKTKLTLRDGRKIKFTTTP